VTTGADRLLLDASVWVDSMTPESPFYAVARTLVGDANRRVGTLALVMHEVTNALGVRRGRPEEAIDVCRLIVGRCGPAIIAPDSMLMRSALSIAAEHGIAAYDASYVAAAHRESWTLVSTDIKDLVSKGLAITPDAAV
jgi:predicted nucleic acid-binding protein